MSGSVNFNHNGRGPSGPSVAYRRVRRLTLEERAALPLVRTKPIEFKGTGLGPWGRWKPGDPVGPVEADPDALLDWAIIAWVREHQVEVVWDFTGGIERPAHELPTDAEVMEIAREAGLEAVD